ncbi:MAG: hypothetical protein R3B84_18685 [Zavarzinella sp.]
MSDSTENIRKQMAAEINAEPDSREALEQEQGQVWDSQELQRDFHVLGFLSPLVVVQRKSDGVKGSLYFQHAPRLYYGFEED